MQNKTTQAARALCRLLAVLALTGALGAQLRAQTTPGGTTIENSASATYSDGNGNNFSTVSNKVTVIVANVSGLIISPDGGSRPTIVAGQSNVPFTFTVTNAGNYTDQVLFLASGQSIQVTGPAVVSSAFVDVNNNGTYEAGTDVDIFSNGTNATSPNIAANASVSVVVNLNINASATNGQSISVQLGDSASDNVTADNSAHEVHTVASGAVNGSVEASGSIGTTVQNDAQLLVTLNAPSGPVPMASNITYGMQVCNTGARDAKSILLPNYSGTSGANSAVFIIAPIPVGTQLAPQTFPAGTLFTTSPLSMGPLAAAWTSAPPGTLSSVTRVAFNVGPTLTAGACSPNVSMVVTITTTDATNPIWEIVDAFGNNSIGTAITDQSGDNVPNAGDGNANFNEDNLPGNQGPQFNGVQQQTLLQATGAVLIGPLGQPAAVGPPPANSNNEDFTNRSVTTGIASIPPSGSTDASGTVVFSNTVLNTGNANDVFTLTAASVPAGFKVEFSTNNGGSYTDVSSGGSVNLPLVFGASANILVRVTSPAGKSVLQGYNTVVRATSTNTPASYNDTIDRLYTGFLRVDKSYVVTNGTGKGGPNAPVPGADIEYIINYSNISMDGPVGNATLTANNITITEDGNAAPNNWGSTTDQVVGSASDARPGSAITGDAAGSTLLTDTLPTLGPGQSGTFRFKRRIK